MVMDLMCSLSTVLRQQQTLPPAVLAQCTPDDRVVVENIAVVAHEAIVTTNLASATLVKDRNKYLLSIPCAGYVCMADMRTVQAYNPARIHDIRVICRESEMVVRIDVCTESAPLSCSELDIVRVTKRSRWF